MLIVRMLAVALFLHEALYVCRDGASYLMRCFVPTFGLQLGPRLHAALHVGLIAGCVVLAAWPRLAWLYPLVLVLLTLTIASYSLRVSNHLILAWFMLLVLCVAALLGPGEARDLESAAFFPAGVRGLVLLTYGFAFLHKLNLDYFSLKHSWGSQLAEFFCWDRGIEDRRIVCSLARVGIYGTLLMEASVPLLLLFAATSRFALVLGLLFHFTLALLGIVNFSAVMYAGLLAFVPAGAMASAAERIGAFGWPTIAVVCALFVLLVWLVTPRHAGRHCPYVLRRTAWLLQWAFGILTALFLLGAVTLPPLSPAGASGRLGTAEGALLLAIWAIFALNGLGPYLGLKTEFSFAMFSNLRCEPWRHLLFPSRWRVLHRSPHVEVERVDGLPDAARLEGDACALLAHRVLSQPGLYRYSPYFLREAVNRLNRFGDRGSRVRLYLRHEDGCRAIDGWDGGSLPSSLRCLPVNLYPFVLPRDPDAPHSEQGTILTRGRQLF